MVPVQCESKRRARGIGGLASFAGLLRRAKRAPREFAARLGAARAATRRTVDLERELLGWVQLRRALDLDEVARTSRPESNMKLREWTRRRAGQAEPASALQLLLDRPDASTTAGYPPHWREGVSSFYDFRFPESGANNVTSDVVDRLADCPEYKLTPVEIQRAL